MIVISKLTNSIFRKLPKALFNKLEGIPEVELFKFKELSVNLKKTYFVHADGESISDRIKRLDIRLDETPINFITGK